MSGDPHRHAPKETLHASPVACTRRHRCARARPRRLRWRRRRTRARNRTAMTNVDPDSLSAELTWWDTSDPTNEGPAFKELIAKFNEKYPNVKINYQSVPFGEAQNKFKTAAGPAPAPRTSCAPRSPGCRSSPRSATSTPWTAPPLLEDDDFLETPLSSNVYDGKTYGVPQVTDSLALMYNKKLFADAGIAEPPKTWAEVEDGRPGAQVQDRRGRASTSTPAATSCCRSSTARAATWSTPTPRRSSSTPPRTSPASRSPRTWSTAAPRSSRPPTTPTAP